MISVLVTYSTNGRCGVNFGRTVCPSSPSPCCSSHGWCGSEEAYCGTDCNPAFGTCKISSTPAPQQVNQITLVGDAKSPQRLYQFGQLRSVNGEYVLNVQPDGNLVILNSSLGYKGVFWSSGTNNDLGDDCKKWGPFYLEMQVRLLSCRYKHLHLSMHCLRFLQGDSNLVLYDSSGQNNDCSAPLVGFSPSSSSRSTSVYGNARNVRWASTTNGNKRRGANPFAILQNDGNLVIYDSETGEALWASRWAAADKKRGGYTACVA